MFCYHCKTMFCYHCKTMFCYHKRYGAIAAIVRGPHIFRTTTRGGPIQNDDSVYRTIVVRYWSYTMELRSSHFHRRRKYLPYAPFDFFGNNEETNGLSSTCFP
ncbi:unnamed protein product [Nesidiocoris tenuis]|uniref:Uncharacterized protein n=1 Tax=Nesidiocoris tenuis TaxID=355587 RepID=A0A6H5H385_9HEMI|nr:unnamed protein product [Nesidiocoris tenuis]